jgi:dTDP-4-amino-4,6-dideoxygalactose transaminase
LWADSVYHLYVVRVPNRDAVRAALQHAGIGTGLHYPLPLHLQDAYRSLNKPEGSYPAAELAAREILSLPMFPGLTENQQRSVAAAINECMAGLAALDPPTYETHHAHV